VYSFAFIQDTQMLKMEAEKIRQWQVQTEMNTKKMVRNNVNIDHLFKWLVLNKDSKLTTKPSANYTKSLFWVHAAVSHQV